MATYDVTSNFNSLFNTINENSFSNFYLNYSKITEQSENEDDFCAEKFIDMIDKIFFIYPDIDEIPSLIIDNEDCYFNGKKFDPLLPRPSFDDIRFNKCKGENCKNDNEFFCEKCQKNLCKKCSDICKNKTHNLIDLTQLKEDTETRKNKIQKILSEIIDDSIKNKQRIPFSRNIALIQSIIKKDYNNYFHYQNIKECYEFFQIYKEIYNNAFLMIKYDINEDIIKEEKLEEIYYKIFSKTFVENNSDKISLIINGKRSSLVETTKINENEKLINVFLIKISEKLIEDMSYMLCNCKSKSIKIIDIENKTNLILENVTNISNMFKNCIYLEEINLNAFHVFKKIKNIDSLFSGCEKLTNILNFDYLETKYVTKMDRIFNFCKSLKIIKDEKDKKNKNGINDIKFDKFNTENVESFDEMFKDCSSLDKLPPEISKWKMGKAKSLKRMFKGCSSLEQFPDIGKWKFEKVESLEGMFEGCSSLEQLPESIANWNVINVQTMEKMFKGCSNLNHLPNIGDWEVNNVKNMKKMFKCCSYLNELPKNLVKWNVENVQNMDEMFSGCIMLGIGNLSIFKQWNLKSIKIMNKMFFGCNAIIREKVKIENLFKFENTDNISYENVLSKKNHILII